MGEQIIDTNESLDLLKELIENVDPGNMIYEQTLNSIDESKKILEEIYAEEEAK